MMMMMMMMTMQNSTDSSTHRFDESDYMQNLLFLILRTNTVMV